MFKHTSKYVNKRFSRLLLLMLLLGATACNAATTSKTDSTASSSPTVDESSQSYQKAENAERRRMVRQQIDTVLTPDQKQQLQTKLQQGDKLRKALADMNLTPEQQAKIKQIFKAAHDQKLQSPSPSPQ
jgi:hypothetical protein